MLGILFYLLIAAIICGAAYYIAGMIPLPGPFLRIFQIILIVIFAIVVLYLLFSMLPMMPGLPRGGRL
jgi:hypothetical protein